MIYDTKKGKGKRPSAGENRYLPYQPRTTRARQDRRGEQRGNEAALAAQDELLNTPPPPDLDVAMATAPPALEPMLSEEERSEEEQQQGLSFHAFNLNHFGGGSDSDEAKVQALREYLETYQPDLLSLTEVNDASQLPAFDGYTQVSGPEMAVGGSVFNKKASSQYESYPVLVREGSGLTVSHAGSINLDQEALGDKRRMLPVRDKAPRSSAIAPGSSRGQEAQPWTHMRPLQIFAVTHPEMGSMLMAPIHTSPSSSDDVAKQAGTYATTTRQVADVMAADDRARAGLAGDAPPGALPPFLLLGDFYNPPVGNREQFEQDLGRAGMAVQRPERLTNVAKDQKDEEKLPADYFISGSMTIADIEALDPPNLMGAGEAQNAAAAWKAQGISDHAPVSGNASWENQQKDHAAFLALAQQAIETVKLIRKID